MKRQQLIVLASVGAVIAVLASYALYTLYAHNNPGTFYDNGVADEEYIAITNQILEAQKFLEKYPNADIEVDRSGRLAVDYRVDTHLSIEGYLRLRIFIDWRTNKTQDMFIDNSGTYITENSLEYLETLKFPS